MSRRTQIVLASISAGAVIIAAIITGGFGLMSNGGGTSHSNDTSHSGKTDDSHNQGSIKGDGCAATVGGAGDGSHNSVTCLTSGPTPDHTFSNNEPPRGPGPWPYVIVNTEVNGNDQGLYIRSCPVESGCVRIGHNYASRVVYAVCRKEHTGFRAGYQDEPDTWLKIKWPTTGEWHDGEPEGTSSPTDAHFGWVFATFTSARDHNGDIPRCEN